MRAAGTLPAGPGGAAELERELEETRRQLAETQARLAIAEILNAPLDPEQALREIARRTARALDFDRCAVILWRDGTMQPLAAEFADGRAASDLRDAFAALAGRGDEVPAVAGALRRGAPLLIPDARADGGLPAAWVEAFDLRTVLVVPLRPPDAAAAVLLLDRPHPGGVGADRLELAATLAAQVAVAVETACRHAAERSRAAELAARVEITQAATSTLELHPLLKRITRHTARALGTERCSISLWRDGHLVPVMSQYADGHKDPDLWARYQDRNRFRRQPMEEVPAHATAIRTKQPVLIEDAEHSGLLSQETIRAFGIRAALVIPLIAKDVVIGTMLCDDSRGPRRWTPADVDLAMSVAAQVALAVENARLYAESEQARAELERKNGELDTFVYSVSHDLKAPLVTIQGMASLVLEEYGAQLPPEAARYLGRIQANTQQMERLILDLLALSRIGRDARPATAVRLDEVVDDVLDELGPALRARDVEVVRSPLPALWGVRTELEQVMRNLLGNAVKYLGDVPRGRVEVGGAARDGVAECWVRDNGIGIDPAYHDRVFEAFQRLKELPVEGTGVGLAIVRKIVHGAGGTVRVESARGAGATFRFTWPTGPAASRPAPPA
jgi:signal transduction histidine kinase